MNCASNRTNSFWELSRMKTKQTKLLRAEFLPLLATKKGQAALMELPPGGKSDEEVSNEHPQSEQWVFVVAGTGTAKVVSAEGKHRSVRLRSGSLLVIERHELHQIENTGKQPLTTMNFYVPPAYRSDGRLRRRA
jgi:oxalate decarboxylase/phosphoglucose isomerase-like protein (cupin superfamily)